MAEVDVGLPIPLGNYSYLPPVQTGVIAPEEQAMNPLLAWLAGQGIDVAAEKTGIKDVLRERGAGLLDLVGLGEAQAAESPDMPPVDTGFKPALPVITAQNADVALGNPVSESPFNPSYNQPAPPTMKITNEDIQATAAKMRQMAPTIADFGKEVEKEVQAGNVQPGGFFDTIKSFLGDEERMAGLAIAFNSMRLTPDASLAAAMEKRIERAGVRRQANRTADYLESIGQKQAADLIRQNPSLAKEIASEFVKGKTPDIKDISSLRKEYTGDAATKAFSEQAQAFGRIVASAKDPSAAGDLALIFNYMKVLDPGSVVREGEFANAQNAGGVQDTIRAQYNNVLRGERLTENQRQDFLTRATMLYDQAEAQHQDVRSGYESIARQRGYDVEEAVPRLYGYKAKKPEGMSDTEWSQLWNVMTPAEKAAFLSGK
jgi:hypothetical protein